MRLIATLFAIVFSASIASAGEGSQMASVSLSDAARQTIANLDAAGYAHTIVSGHVYAQLDRSLAVVDSLDQTLIIVGSPEETIDAGLFLPTVAIDSAHFHVPLAVAFYEDLIGEWIGRPAPHTYEAYLNLVNLIYASTYRDAQFGICAGRADVATVKEQYLESDLRSEMVVVVPENLLAHMQEYVAHGYYFVQMMINDMAWRSPADLQGYRDGGLEIYPEIYATACGHF